jgi:AraC-like DNA-binding protein
MPLATRDPPFDYMSSALGRLIARKAAFRRSGANLPRALFGLILHRQDPAPMGRFDPGNAAQQPHGDLVLGTGVGVITQMMDRPETGGIQSYCDAVRRTIFPMDLRFANDATEQFYCRFVTRRFGSIEMTSSFSTARVAGRRRERLIDSPDEFVLVIVNSGLVRRKQFGRSVETPAGYMSLIHSRSAYESEQVMPTGALYIKIPGSQLRAAISAPEDFCAVALDARKGLNAAFCGFLASVWKERDVLTEDDKYLLSKKSLEMLSMVLTRHECRRLTPSSPSSTHFNRALRFIESHLNDPTLSVTRVAKELAISRNHLYTIFRDKVPPGHMILSMRLERCRHAFVDQRRSHLRIVDIAFDMGFNDVAHFSRTFKAKFGMSPRAYRKMARAS